MAKLKVVKSMEKTKVDLPTASEPKAVRGFPEIHAEFSSLCFQVGQLQYQIFAHNKDIDLLNNRIRDLNFEAASLKAKQDAEKVEKDKAAAKESEKQEESK